MAAFFKKPSGYTSPKLRGENLGPRGRAVYAKSAIPRDEIICIWGGRILPVEEIKKMGPEGVRLSVQIDDGFVTYSDVEGISDWFNHSCEPNSGLSGQITLVALRDIAEGEEVTFDYAFCDSSDYDEFKCQCGKPSCRGVVTGRDWQNPTLQEKHFAYFATYLQKKIVKNRARR
jgi:hypothetical protein